MLPTTPHRTERVLDRLAARARPKRQTPLQPRDKRSHFEMRRLHVRYDDEMSQAHDNLHDRERDLAAWLTGVAREKKRLYGWTTDDTIDQSPIDRATWYRWKKISKPGNMPRPQKLDEFCERLGLDPTIPYGILGWGQPSKRFESSGPPAEPPPEPALDRMIRLIETRLKQSPPAPERRELELRLVRARRARDVQRLADELMAEIDRDEISKRERGTA